MMQIKKLGLLLLFVGGLTACQSTEVATSKASIRPIDLPAMKSFTTNVPSFGPYSNAQLARDFIDLHFNLENGAPLPAFTRFEGPISIRVVNSSSALTQYDFEQLLKNLRTRAAIPITQVGAAKDANLSIEFVPAAELARRAPNTACIVVPNLSSWSEFRTASRAQISWATMPKRERIAIFLPIGDPPQEVRDCLHEELAQALGPLNDLYRLQNSTFNDDNIHSILTDYDYLILRATYASELTSGMSKDQVRARLPAILARLNPAGQTVKDPGLTLTPSEWQRSIQTALTSNNPVARINNARNAIAISQKSGWTDGRAGFSWFLLGRLLMGNDPVGADAALSTAAQLYRSNPATRTHEAHVALQRAALAISNDQYDLAYRISAAALPKAREAQNAALLSSLMMVEAEALDALGQSAEAKRLRLDSLGWARYGFGTPQRVYQRLGEIASLAR